MYTTQKNQAFSVDSRDFFSLNQAKNKLTSIKYLVLLLLIFSNQCIIYGQQLRPGMIVSYWQELSIKPGIVLGADWEWMYNETHGVAFTFPQLTIFIFPYNSVHLYLTPVLSYRFVSARGFYTSLGLGLGLSMEYFTPDVYNSEGIQIRDKGLYRGVATAQYDIGYDFEKKFPWAPLRLFFTVGWKGLFPHNTKVNSHIIFQIGINAKLPYKGL